MSSIRSAEFKNPVESQTGARRSTPLRAFGKRAALAMLVLSAVPLANAANDNVGSDESYRQIKTFTDVLALVQKNYVKEVNFGELMEGAIRGLLLTLDPHSSYMNPDTYKELQVETKGEFGGLGIEITMKDQLLTVIAAIEDSPAAQAGVKPGDRILKIGDEFTKDVSLVDAVKRMRGPKGSPITISVAREGHQGLIPLTVVRDIIKVKSVRSRMLEEGFGYIRLAQFQEESSHEFTGAVTQLGKMSPQQQLRGLVIDLRSNPGGLLVQAIRVADIFLRDGVVVYTDGRLESQKQKYFAHDDGNEPSYPIVVLVNGGSASASEIVAGALQDFGRAVILGTQTFGKGSVQTILPMENGGALRLTTALYFTKSGRSIQAEGITPDVVVQEKPTNVATPAPDREDLPQLKERDLPGALKSPNKKPGASETPAGEIAPGDKSTGQPQKEKLMIGSRQALVADLKELLVEDPQLREALHLLKTWHVFQGKPAGTSAAHLEASEAAA